MKGNKIKLVIFDIFKYVMLIIAALVALVPILVCIFAAFKTNDEYASSTALQLPKSFLYFDNFRIAIEKANMIKCFANTFIVLIVVLICSVLISAMTAYVLNRFTFPGRGMIENLFLFASLLPGIAMQVTIYQIMYKLGLINHLYGYMIVLMGTDIISIYIFLQFFENLPVSLDESAIIDGCTYFGIFFKILLPLLKPAIMTSLVLKGVSVYNEYYASSLYLQNEELKTISTALYTFTGPYGNQYNYICAGVLITIAPILIFFLIFQKQVYSGMASGAVKG
ncbi:carbohydrate ABC transporter permease [Agathobacter sp.]|uniref:carbohydrate ABC transporter permease n=1 Tax=Agathobacter sp. TaxID=2021311 RepID=UPI00280A601C|nr:carbohydrate ABC transporter permease [Agathobacter sp.]